MVMICHAIFTGYARPLPEESNWVYTILGKGWLGVPLFFVISGYCITASVCALQSQGISTWQFFRRRFQRIYPPYWIWLGVVAVSIYGVETFVAPGYFQRAAVPLPQRMTGWQWLGNLTLTETWLHSLVRGLEVRLWAPMWTLCYEEQFYFVVGILLVVGRRWFFFSLTLLTIIVCVGIFAFRFNTRGTFLDGSWLMFAAGVLVYYILNCASLASRKWFCLPLVLGALCAVADPKQMLRPGPNEPNQSYLAAFCFALVLVRLKAYDQHLAGSHWLRPLRCCGEMCYSLYLIHWPVVTIVGRALDSAGITNPTASLLITVPVSIGVAIVISRIFHQWVERKFWNRQLG